LLCSQVDECITSKSGQAHACLRSGGALDVVQGADPKASDTKVLHVINEGASGKHKKGAYTAKLADGALAVFFQPANKKAQEEKVFSTPTSDGDYVHLAEDGTVGVFETLYSYGCSTLWSTSSEPAAAATVDSTCESSSSAVTEPATGITMPRVEKFGASELSLLGVGVRAKTLVMIKVNVYAVGLYVEPKAAAKALAKFTKEEPSKLQSNAAFYETLLKVSHSSLQAHMYNLNLL
jgi:Chalcone isomerase like